MASSAVDGFHAVDYVIFALVLITSLGIGLYHAFTGGRQRTTKEFFLGNRNLKTLPVAASMLVSFLSAIIILGTPAEMYTKGAQLTMRTIGYCLACVLSSIIFVPLFYPLKVTSAFEYLERRYSSKLVKLLGTISMLVGIVFYMGLIMYTPSTALEAVTGFPVWGSILACGAVAVVYTTLGGMRAVIWTDVFQMLVMVGGMLVIVIQGTLKVGGLLKVWNISKDGGRLIFFDFNPDPTLRISTWSLVIGGMVNTLTIFGIGQTSVQRYCALPSLAQAKRSLYLNIFGLLLMNLLASLTGLVVYAYFASIKCDPLKQGYIRNSNQLVPYFVSEVLRYPGLNGIFAAVLFSGALSSMSSMLNAASAVTWEDMLKYFFKDFSELRKTLITKILVIFYGGLAVCMSFLAKHIGGHVLYASLSFSGATTGPSLGLFLLGALFPMANKKGAVAGWLLASLACMWIAVGAFITRPHAKLLDTSVENCLNSSTSITNYQIGNGSYFTTNNSMSFSVETTFEDRSWVKSIYSLSFLWYSTLGLCITLFIGLPVSWLTGGAEKEVDPKLLIPIFDRLCCCLPARIRRKLQCGRTSSEEEDSSRDSSSSSRTEEESSLPLKKRSNQSTSSSDVEDSPLTL